MHDPNNKPTKKPTTPVADSECDGDKWQSQWHWQFEFSEGGSSTDPVSASYFTVTPSPTD